MYFVIVGHCMFYIYVYIHTYVSTHWRKTFVNRENGTIIYWQKSIQRFKVKMFFSFVFNVLTRSKSSPEVFPLFDDVMNFEKIRGNLKKYFLFMLFIFGFAFFLPLSKGHRVYKKKNQKRNSNFGLLELLRGGRGFLTYIAVLLSQDNVHPHCVCVFEKNLLQIYF
jgi:hypothetical protein